MTRFFWVHPDIFFVGTPIFSHKEIRVRISLLLFQLLPTALTHNKKSTNNFSEVCHKRPQNLFKIGNKTYKRTYPSNNAGNTSQYSKPNNVLCAGYWNHNARAILSGALSTRKVANDMHGASVCNMHNKSAASVTSSCNRKFL